MTAILGSLDSLGPFYGVSPPPPNLELVLKVHEAV
jgi:hypothetical protein